jgi:predicted XRE-type DNA-binding protein
MSTEESRFVRSSGNVFADLGMPEPELELAKADLALAITQRIRRKGLTQTRAAAILGDSQPNVSMLTRGKVEIFSYDRLLHHLNALGMDVELTIKEAPADRPAGHLSVRMA